MCIILIIEGCAFDAVTQQAVMFTRQENPLQCLLFYFYY